LGDVLKLDSRATVAPQGYRLRVEASGVTAEAGDAAGLFYAMMTLAQVIRVAGAELPFGVIDDAPDFQTRGVMIDISRDKVPTMETLYALVDDLAGWKVNHLQLYIEHTFAYAEHRTVWEHASPMTSEEIRALDAYCRARFVELAPNQNSFGHMARWLKHDAYRHLAETPDGWRTPEGLWRDEPWSLDPTNPDTLAFLDGLYAELLPNFTSRNLNIGCDETWDLGQGNNRELCEQVGRDRVYLDFLNAINERAQAHGCTAHYWGDVVWEHAPAPAIDLAKLNPEMVMVDWGYIRAYPFEEHGEALADKGLPFWFAPGTGVWSTLVGCNESAFGSNRSAAEAGLRHGALGILNADWGDGGHWQYHPVSLSGFAAGAALAWCAQVNPDETIVAAFSSHVFRDEAGVMGEAVHLLADTWTKVTPEATQANLLNGIIQGGLDHELPPEMTVATLAATEAHIESAIAQMADSRMGRADGELMLDEFRNGARMAVHACRLGRTILDGETSNAAVLRELADDMHAIVNEHRRLWLARNREGGLDDSVRVLKERLSGYTDAR
jgi:hypothetical protein